MVIMCLSKVAQPLSFKETTNYTNAQESSLVITPTAHGAGIQLVGLLYDS